MSKAGIGHTLREVVRFNDQLGFIESVRSLDYFRCIEYPLVIELLELKPHIALLDLGVGRGPFSTFLALRRAANVLALDIDPGCISWQAEKAQHLGPGHSDFQVMVSDSRCLPFPEGSFDRVLNLGSIEHIRGEGDRQTAIEMGRVLKPGGIAVFSIPYGNQCTERESDSHVKYFERRYDERAIEDRIIQPSGLKEVTRFYFGETGRRWSRFWYNLPFALKLPFRRLTPWMASRWLQVIPVEERECACGICFALVKE